MNRLILTREMLSRVRAEVLATELETYCILFGRSVEINGKLARIVIREFISPPLDAYTERTAVRVQLRPEFVATLAQRARKTGEAVVFAHSHPFPFNAFSKTDDEGEKVLAEFFRARVPQSHHAALLVTPEVCIARELGTDLSLNVAGVGPEILWGQPISG